MASFRLPSLALVLAFSSAAACSVYDSSLLITDPYAGQGAGGTDLGGQGGSGGEGEAGGGGAGGNQAGSSGSSAGGKAGTGGAGGGGSGGSSGKAGMAGAPGGSAGASGKGGSGGSGGSGGKAGSGGSSGNQGGSSGASGSAGQGGSAGSAPSCTGASDCDDKNPCTTDACGPAGCTHTPDDTQTPPQTAGDCKKAICQGGQSFADNDDADVPDDGDPCTTDTCSAGVPGHTPAADGTMCQLSGASGVCKAGKCQAACSTDSECDDKNPCTTDACTMGLCANTSLPDGPTPGAVDTAGDCQTNVCMGGKDTVVADTSDLPTATDECQVPTCSPTGMPGASAKPDGTACTANGGQLCLMGACKPDTCGNGFARNSEQCDGADLAGKDCSVAGFAPGSTGLACKADCTLDPTGCKATCGNGLQEPGEECDDSTSPAAPGDGCSKYCRKEPAVGDLVITEVMFNPESGQAGSVENGEYIEVYNAGASTLDLRGLQLDCPTAGTKVVIADGSATPLDLAPKAYALLVRSSDPTKNGGISAFTWSYNGVINLGNSVDTTLRIVVPAATPLVIDTMSYTKTIAGSSTYKGVSYSLSPGALSAAGNDVATNWCPSKSDYGTPSSVTSIKDKGTPGLPNDSCPLWPSFSLARPGEPDHPRAPCRT